MKFNPKLYFGYLVPTLSVLPYCLVMREKIDWFFLIWLIPGINWVSSFLLFSIPGRAGSITSAGVLWNIAIHGFWIIVGLVLLKWKLAAEIAARIAAEQRDMEARRLKAFQETLERQLKLRSELLRVAELAIGLLESIPVNLGESEDHLARAEIDYKDGAIDPFWSSIERVADRLCRVDNSIRQIHNLIREYSQLARECMGEVPPFPIGAGAVPKLAVTAMTASRMKELVRLAHCNFHFASIYQTRRTNILLFEGFGSLTDAIDRMNMQLESSLDHLRSDFAGLASTTAFAIEDVGRKMAVNGEVVAEILSKSGEAASDSSRQLLSRQDRALDMLDNIQRGRSPISGSFAKVFTTVPRR